MDDRSIGKETRTLAPFLDLLDLHELVLAGEEAGGTAAAALPGTGAQPRAAQGQADAPASFEAKLGPLPPAPAAPAADADAGPQAALPGQPAVAAPMGLSAPVVESAGAMTTAKAAASSAAHGKFAKEGHAHATHTDATHHERELDGIRVRIDQDVDVDQDIDADVAIEADDVDLNIDVEATVDADQTAAVSIRAETAEGPPHAAMAASAAVGDDVSMDGRQDVDTDTIIRVDVTGYAGEVVITTSLTEEADIDQAAQAVFRADAGDEVFDIDVSQFLDLDLLTDIDIDIREIGGRLVIDLSVRSEAEGDDIIRLDVSESADDVLDVDLEQRADIDQRVSVDLTVEAELARLFDIDVDVDADVSVEVRQNADVDGVIAEDGSAAWDAESSSEIDIDNLIRIRLDFSTH
jgi:hypothetical protein